MPAGKIFPRKWPTLIQKTYLTKRERQVVRLLGRGLTGNDICEILDITRTNFDSITYRIRKKM